MRTGFSDQFLVSKKELITSSVLSSGTVIGLVGVLHEMNEISRRGLFRDLTTPLLCFHVECPQRKIK